MTSEADPNVVDCEKMDKLMHGRDRITESTKRTVAANFKNTDLGLVRIAENLGLGDMAVADVVRHCKKIILSTPVQNIEARGKNYYLYSQEYSAVLTINKSSLGIITAKRHE